MTEGPSAGCQEQGTSDARPMGGPSVGHAGGCGAPAVDDHSLHRLALWLAEVSAESAARTEFPSTERASQALSRKTAP